MRKSINRILKFVFVGLITVSIDAAFYTILATLGVDTFAAKAASFICGSIFAYLANWKFTFEKNKSKSSIPKFALLYLSSLIINVMGNQVLLKFFNHENLNLVFSFLVITFVTTVWNYIGMANFVFRGNNEQFFK